MQWKTLTVLLTVSLALLFFLVPVSKSTTSYAAITSSTRFKLNAYNTYIYTANTLYAYQIKVYTNQIVFTNVYDDADHVLDSLTVKVENANLTVNTWFDGVKFEGTVSAPSGTTSTTTLVVPASLGKPSVCKLNGVEMEEGKGWTWQDASYTLTFTTEHHSSEVLTAEWVTTGTGGSSGSSGGAPSPLPPPQPSPPIAVPIEPTRVNLVVIGVIIIVGVILFATVSGEEDTLLSSRKRWKKTRSKTKKTKWKREKAWD